MKIIVENRKTKKIRVPEGTFYDSDWFKCERCGYTVRMKVLGNTATCSQCGGTMRRV